MVLKLKRHNGNTGRILPPTPSPATCFPSPEAASGTRLLGLHPQTSKYVYLKMPLAFFVQTVDTILGIHHCCLFHLKHILKTHPAPCRLPPPPPWLRGEPLGMGGCCQAGLPPRCVTVCRPRSQEHAQVSQSHRATQSKGGSQPGTWLPLPFPSAPPPPTSS